MQTGESFDPEEKQRVKNKKRLLIQNRKLNSQIRKLEEEMNQILSIKDVEEDRKSSVDLSKQRSQISIQQSYIKKLKGKIDFLKSANVKENSFFIRKEEDSLLIVKKEYQNLQDQKQTILKLIEDKKKTLGKNEPFQAYKQSIQENLFDVKGKNRKMNSQLVQLERQSRQYHSYIQLQKKIDRDNIAAQNFQLQISKTDTQIKQINKKAKDMENKWKPQYQALDREYFQLKNHYLLTKDKLYDTEKEFRQSETRISALREEEEVMDFRQRLSKIHTMDPTKFAKNTEKVKRKRQPIFWKKTQADPDSPKKSPKIKKKKSTSIISENSKIQNQMSPEQKIRQAKRQAILEQKNKKRQEKEDKMKKQQERKDQQIAKKKRRNQNNKPQQKLVRTEWNQPPKVVTDGKKPTGNVSHEMGEAKDPSSPKKQGKLLLKSKGTGP